MQGSYMRSSSSLLHHYSAMDLRRDNSYMNQPSSFGEPMSYLDGQLQYADTLRDVARPSPIDYRNMTTPSLHLQTQTNHVQSRPAQNSWSHQEALEAQESSECHQPLQNPYLHQEYPYADDVLFAESYRMPDASDFEVSQDILTSPSASPAIDSSPTIGKWPMMDEEPVPAFPAEIKDSPDEEASGDKPYARLIHEALMQAPGHKMMLREIYDWFTQHTSKPSESGTNGWQNSIRHNLSMNQAFENDRTDFANPSHQAKKANSVWILTEDAVKHGVQSTTRYRKHGSNKKANRARIPAPLRQRSGAKGGRAARRAAKMRREEEMNRQDCPPSTQNTTAPQSYEIQAIDATSQTDCFFPASPLTPESESALTFPLPLENNSYCYTLPNGYGVPTEMLRGHFEESCGAASQPKGDACMKGLLACAYTPPTQTATP